MNIFRSYLVKLQYYCVLRVLRVWAQTDNSGVGSERHLDSILPFSKPVLAREYRRNWGSIPSTKWYMKVHTQNHLVGPVFSENIDTKTLSNKFLAQSKNRKIFISQLFLKCLLFVSVFVGSPGNSPLRVHFLTLCIHNAHYVSFNDMVDQMVGWDPTQRCPSSSCPFTVQVNVLER